MTQNISKGMAVIVLSLFFCTSFSASAQVGTINYKGNVLEVKNMADTTEVLDPITMETLWEIRNPNPIPLKLNNMNIYADNEVEQRPSATGEVVRKYLIQQISGQVKADGEYRLMLDNIIISDKGKIVYHNFNGLEKKTTITTNHSAPGDTPARVSQTNRWKETDKKLSASLANQIEKAIDKAPTYKPAMVYNQPVPCQLDTKELQRPFTIKGGMVQY